jgi:hypothetical protein
MKKIILIALMGLFVIGSLIADIEKVASPTESIDGSWVNRKDREYKNWGVITIDNGIITINGTESTIKVDKEDFYPYSFTYKGKDYYANSSVEDLWIKPQKSKSNKDIAVFWAVDSDKDKPPRKK